MLKLKCVVSAKIVTPEGVDWERIKNLVSNDHLEEMLNEIESCMRKSKAYHFKYMKEGLQTHCLDEVVVATVNLIF